MQGQILFPGGRGAATFGLAPHLPFDRLFDKAVLRGTSTGTWAVLACRQEGHDALVLGIFCETTGRRLLFFPQPNIWPTEGDLKGELLDHFTIEVPLNAEGYDTHTTYDPEGSNKHQGNPVRRTGLFAEWFHWAIRDLGDLPRLPQTYSITVQPSAGDTAAFAKKLFGTGTAWILPLPPVPAATHLKLVTHARNLNAKVTEPPNTSQPADGVIRWKLGEWEVTVTLTVAQEDFDSMLAKH